MEYTQTKTDSDRCDVMIPNLTRRSDIVVALGSGKRHDDKKRIDSTTSY